MKQKDILVISVGKPDFSKLTEDQWTCFSKVLLDAYYNFQDKSKNKAKIKANKD